jgi:hypothetical protein
MLSLVLSKKKCFILIKGLTLHAASDTYLKKTNKLISTSDKQQRILQMLQMHM